MQVINITNNKIKITRLKLFFEESSLMGPTFPIFCSSECRTLYKPYLLSNNHLFIRKSLAFIVTFALVFQFGMLILNNESKNISKTTFSSTFNHTQC